MRKTQSLSITLPREMARMVKNKVASGAYATESEVIREGLRALEAQESVLEEWLHTEGVTRHDAYHRNPRRGRPAARYLRASARLTSSEPSGEKIGKPMAWTVIVGDEAEADLFAIREYITGRAGEATALRFIEHIEAYCLGFSTVPE